MAETIFYGGEHVDAAVFLAGNHITEAGSGIARTFMAIGALTNSEIGNLSRTEIDTALTGHLEDITGYGPRVQEVADALLEIPPYAVEPVTERLVLSRVQAGHGSIDEVLNVASYARGTDGGNWKPSRYVGDELRSRYRYSNLLVGHARPIRQDVMTLQRLAGELADSADTSTRAPDPQSAFEEDAAGLVLKWIDTEGSDDIDKELTSLRTRVHGSNERLLWAARTDKPHTLKLLGGVATAYESGQLVGNQEFPSGMLSQAVLLAPRLIETFVSDRALTLTSDSAVNGRIIRTAALEYLGLRDVARRYTLGQSETNSPSASDKTEHQRFLPARLLAGAIGSAATIFASRLRQTSGPTET